MIPRASNATPEEPAPDFPVTAIWLVAKPCC
jgi:hypothetical protein